MIVVLLFYMKQTSNAIQIEVQIFPCLDSVVLYCSHGAITFNSLSRAALAIIHMHF